MAMPGVTGRPSSDMVTELPEMRWRSMGACLGMFESLSFWAPTSEQNYMKAERPADRAHRERACREVCAGCAVRVECREWAIVHGELGVWGGTNDEERHHLRLGRDRAFRVG